MSLVDQARGLPPEFRADILLRLSDSPLITETTWKQELIEEAFWSGAHAPLPYLQWADRHSDSVAENAVRQNRLEALTLQTRAVQAMVAHKKRPICTRNWPQAKRATAQRTNYGARSSSISPDGCL